MRSVRSAPAGFTLLEILVVLLIFAMVQTVLWAGLHAGLQGWKQQGEEEHALDDFQTIERVLRFFLSNAEAGDDEHNAFFHGTETSLDFISTMPDPETGQRRFVRVGVFVTAGHQLALNWQNWTWARPLKANAAVHQEILSDSVKSLSLSYYDAETDQPGWQEGWSDGPAPALVRIQVQKLVSATGKRAQGKTLTWPAFVVSVPMAPRFKPVPPSQRG